MANNSNTKKLKEWKEWCKHVQDSTSIESEESEKDKLQRIHSVKADYNSFVSYYFPHYADSDCADFQVKEANAVKKDPNYFGVWEWPREHAKSVHADVIVPLWLKANTLLNGMILVGKNYNDACRQLSDIQAELEFNQRFIADFGVQLTLGNWMEGDFTTADNIEFIAIGRGQSPRGFRNQGKRPNYCVVDDIDDDEIVKNESRVEKVVEWLLGSLYGAMDIRNSIFIMIGNRIHPKSILAHVVGDIDGKPKRKGLRHSKVMATVDGTFTGKPSWHQKFTSEQLQLRFSRMGTFMALREYFHKAVIKGKHFKNDWINWGRVPRLNSMDNIVAYFDPSYKPKTTSDYKAISVWANKGIKLYKIDQFCKQTTITEAVKWMYDLHEEMIQSNCVCEYWMEDVFLQDMFFDDFEEEARIRGYYLPIRGDKRKKPDKFARIMSLAPLYERGLVTYNIKQKNNQHFRDATDQLIGFEKGSSIHDDAPDADEGAIWMIQRRARVSEWQGTVGQRKSKLINGY